MGATADPTGSRTVRSVVALLAAPSGVGAGRDPTAAGDASTDGVGVIVEGEDAETDGVGVITEGEDDSRDALGTAGLGGVFADDVVDADGIGIVVE